MAAEAGAGPHDYILVVDDNESIQGAVELILQEAGYTARSALGGRDALELVVAGPPPRLVLVDLWMPDVDGRMLLRELKRQFPRLPIIMMSAAWNEEPELDGADAYLRKPFGRRELLEVVKRVWSG